MRVLNRYLLCVSVLSFAVLPITACETIDGMMSSDKPATNVAVVNRVDAPVAPSVPPIPSKPLTDSDLRNMTATSSGGSVEVYGVDGDRVTPATVTPVQPDYIGIPMANDPRVIIYPLDGDAGAFPVPLGTPEWNRAGYRPRMTSPAVSTSPDMTSAPSNLWQDETMESKEGVLSPRIGNDVSSVYFRYGSAAVNGESRKALSKIADTAKFAPVDRVSIEGHASKKTQTPDPIKSKILNLKESMNRVQAVSQKLMEEGVPAEKIKTTAWGDTKPSGAGEANDRRVDIITGAGGQ